MQHAAIEVERRRGGAPRKPRTMAASLGAHLIKAAIGRGSEEPEVVVATEQRARWQREPVAFAREVLGVEVWNFQRELLEMIRDHRHVAVAGGRKIGKDYAIAIAALWWFASFADARVILLAPTSKQLDGIAYREIRMLWAGMGRCVDCKKANPEGPRPCPHSTVLPATVGLLARTGIVAADFREIRGQTAISEGGLRGMSGARILAIEDEASDIKDEFDNALVGNLAGADCHRVLISNPTRTQGFFHRAFHEERHLFKTLQVSTESNPNVVAGREVVRGLGTREWIAEREVAWGRGSAAWSANVEGQFVKAEQGQLFTLEAIRAAELRWDDADADGRLTIGADVAGEGHDGDETVFAVRRGRKVHELVAHRGLSPDAILAHLRGLLSTYRVPRLDEGDNIPLLVLDRDGGVGARVYDRVNAYRMRDERTEAEFALIGFQGGQPPRGRLAERYRWTRDALFGGLEDAFREGLAIPSDVKLEGELVALRWLETERGKSTLEAKTDMRARLGRSPDRLDALALCTHGAQRVAVDALPVVALRSAAPIELDPYDDVDGGQEVDRVFDPYGGR